MFSKWPAQRVCLQNQNEKVCPNLHSSSIKDMRTKKPITSISGHGNIYNYIFIKRLYYSIYTLFNKLSRERKAKSEALLHITSQIVHFLLKGRKGAGGKYYGRNRHTQSHEQTESKGKTIFTTLVPSEILGTA